jgi:uncharacterized protein YceK
MHLKIPGRLNDADPPPMSDHALLLASNLMSGCDSVFPLDLGKQAPAVLMLAAVAFTELKHSEGISFGVQDVAESLPFTVDVDFDGVRQLFAGHGMSLSVT